MLAYKRGKALANRGQTQEALIAYDEALRLNPELARAYFDRGVSARFGRQRRRG